MSHKFKIGDRVRVTESYADCAAVNAGDFGTVTSFEGPGLYSVQMDIDRSTSNCGGEWLLSDPHLKPADNVSRFEKGDRVKYIQRDDSTYPYGLVGKVTGATRTGVSFRSDDGTEFLGGVSEFVLIDNVVQLDARRDTVALDPSDPFESVIIDMVQTNRRKRADYAVDGSPFSNFDDTARNLGVDGFTAADSAIFNVLQKIARLRSLRANGRMHDTANESVADTYLDLAVYAVIALAIHKHPSGETTPPETKDAA